MSTSKSASVIVLAQRYATALFERLCDDAASVEVFQTIQEQLNVWAALETQADFAQVLNLMRDPAIVAAQRLAAVQAVLDAQQAHPMVAALVTLMVSQHRFEALPAVAGVFEQLSAQRSASVKALLQTPVALTKALEEQLVKAIKARLGCQQVVLNVDLQPSLIGGCVLQIGDWLMDGSYRSRLQKLQQLT